MRAYHRLSLTPIFRRSGSSRPENIPNSSDGVNHQLLFTDLAPQAMHEHIDDIGLRIETVIKYVFEDHVLCAGPIWVAHQVFEQCEFARLQVDLQAAAPHLAREQIHGQIAYRQSGWFRGLGGAANERLDASQQLREGERLGKIVISAGLKPAHAVIHAGLGAQNEDWNA